ncbi:MULTISPECIES: flagellar hook-length control protein FliK [Methylosinus]|uniref:flagellar hook-length control protein FliK n=1 Tax=Methylosinus TaxID=425 RepID=UPI0012DD9B00|nr:MULTISPECIES: flagellar hook-length control protein FliK [Methylosinus]
MTEPATANAAPLVEAAATPASAKASDPVASPASVSSPSATASAPAATEPVHDDGLLALLRSIPAGRLAAPSTVARPQSREDASRSARPAGSAGEAARSFDLAAAIPSLISDAPRPSSAASPVLDLPRSDAPDADDTTSAPPLEAADFAAVSSTSQPSASPSPRLTEATGVAWTLPAALAASRSVPASAEVESSPDATPKEEIVATPLGRVDLSAPTAQPAPAMAALLVPQARSLLAQDQSGAAPATATRRAADAAPRATSNVVKSMTIELAPESLGAVVVKMKLVHSGVEMKISVRSSEALNELESSRDALVAAMRSAGCAIDGCTIQIAAPAADGAQAQAAGQSFDSSANGANSERRDVAGEGAGDGQGTGGRRRESERDDGAAESVARRSVDRRSGGVYL